MPEKRYHIDFDSLLGDKSSLAGEELEESEEEDGMEDEKEEVSSSMMMTFAPNFVEDVLFVVFSVSMAEQTIQQI
jgi:hypothetical protein